MNAVMKAPAGTQVLERVQRDFESVAQRLPGQILGPEQRRQALEQLVRAGWPTTRDELWRYTTLRAFEKIGAFSPAALTPISAPAELPVPLPGFERRVYVDGIRQADAPHDSDTAPLSAQWADAQRLGWLTEAFACDAAVLRVRGSAAVELLFLATARADGRAIYPRLSVSLEPGASLTLVERHLGESTALVAGSVTIELARGAQLTHYRLQQYGTAAACSDSLSVQVAERASYRVRHVCVGAASGRTSALVRLAGPGATLDWQAIAVGRAEQALDSSLEVAHQASDTRSNQVFRAIADERARLAFHGHVRIERAARGAQARQSLRGLSEGAAEIDLRPRMQIDVDEVSAQHGATTGQLDEQLLFYLLSRGLSPATARALLKWAFLGDVLRAIELPELRRQAENAASGGLHERLPEALLPEPHATGSPEVHS